MDNYLQFNNITKQYGTFKALDEVSFSINKGHCVALLGINGAGKTTALKVLTGLLKPTDGEIYYRGNKIDASSIEFKKNIGYLAQSPSFYEWMTGYDFLSYMSDLYGISKVKRNKKISEVLEIVKLTDAKKKKIRGYSGGMRQRLGIAQAILHDPQFLVLDEPVSALDPEGRYQVIQLLQELKKSTTILLSTHILHDADNICDDVIVLHGGQKIIETKLEYLKNKFQEPIVKISLKEKSDKVVSILKQIEWIEDISVNLTELEIRVKRLDLALNRLPIILLENNLPFLSFQVFEPTLEDTFLKLVKNK